MGAQHVAGVVQRRQAVGTRDRQRRVPGAGEDRFGGVLGHGVRRPGPRKALVDVVAEDLGAQLRLVDALLRDVDAEVAGQDRAGVLVLEPADQLPRDAEAGGDDAAGVTRVHAGF